MSADYYQWQDGYLIFNVLLQPKASRNALIGLHDNAIKITLISPPVDGAANKQLIQFLAKLFRVRKSNVAILAGEHSRHKRVSVCEPSQLPRDFFK